MIFQLKRLARVKGGKVLSLALPHIIRMHTREPASATLLLQGAAGKIRHSWVKKARPASGPAAQSITGAAVTMVRKRASLSRRAASARRRSVRSRKMP